MATRNQQASDSMQLVPNENQDAESRGQEESPSENEGNNSPNSPVERSEIKYEKQVESYNQATFWNRKKGFSMIEVLMQSFEDKDILRGVSQNIPVDWTRDIGDELRVSPSRVRIRSALLVALLNFIAERGCHKDCPKETELIENEHIKIESGDVSIVYLYPFKLFVRFETVIRKFLEFLETGKTKKPDFPEPFEKYPKEFQSRQAAAELKILIGGLFDNKLAPIFKLREGFRNGTQTTLAFDDLWLLFEPGELVYQPKTSEPSPNNCARLWQVTQYDGGRPILNDDKNKAGTKSKPVYGQVSETNFILRGASREANQSFEKAVPVHETISIPPWDGTRDVQTLKAYPLRFYRPEKEIEGSSQDKFLERLRKEGKQYCGLNQGLVQDYRGPAFRANNEEWEYRSEVIIDTVRGRKEAPGLFVKDRTPVGSLLRWFRGLGASDSEQTTISIVRGDSKEVQDVPLRESAIAQEGKIQVVDSIYDDVNMEFEYFRHRSVVKELRESPLLSELAKQEDDERLLLLPRMICGFVLSARTWANLYIEFLKPHEFDKTLWDDVILPKGYTDLLLATVENHPRVESSERVRLHGKGTGTTILLQGHPGTGKTFTAEALAAKTNRVIYPITSGELGDTAASVEKNLETFLQRGQRWNCILLLDEADVYLTKRRYGEIVDRNSIVSVFLRLIEYYTGIIVMTTNWFTPLDPAFVNRVTLPLVYPPLNREALSILWLQYMGSRSILVDAVPKNVRITVDKSTHSWALDKYKERHDGTKAHDKFDEKCPWHSARQIQNAFRLAISLVLHREMLDRRRMGLPDTFANPSGGEIHLQVRVKHFQAVFEHYEGFYARVRDLPQEGEQNKQKPVQEDLKYQEGSDPPGAGIEDKGL